MSLAARLFASFLLPFLAWVHDGRYADDSLDRTRQAAGRFTQKAEAFWQNFANEALTHALKERDFAKSELLVAADPRTERGEIEPDAEAKQAALKSAASYGRIPEVIADRGVAFIFPRAIEPPTRFSSFRAAVDVGRGLTHIRRLKHALADWRKLRPGSRMPQLQALLAQLDTIDALLLQAAQELRISQTWVPRHILALSENSGPTQRPRAYHALDAILGHGAAGEKPPVGEVREQLRPRREIFHPFLPYRFQSHRGKTIRIPAVTDIAQARFREEFEGAVDTYWNQSSWARGLEIRFAFDWKTVALNERFLKRQENLDAHLKRFPAKRMVLTTGAQSTQVFGTAMVLGPGQVTPRTLAHEFGHILGFPDCYLRTIAGEGLFGIGVLEWNNPFFPDELMCDNHLGIVHAIEAD